MERTTPAVSVIVPVFNTGKYLAQCLDSIANQTLRSIEVICVDDGSTDNSLSILGEYAAKDARFTVIAQQNRYAGMARNEGIKIARGEYLSFLDSDDFFEHAMLAEAYGKCSSLKADIGIFRIRRYMHETKEYSAAGWTLNTKYIPPKEVFSHRDIPQHIFFISSPGPCNKLFKRDFILKNKLQFQETRSANDVRFVYFAMILAERITVIDKDLLNYRVGHGGNLQATQDKDPLAFYAAYSSLKEHIEKTGRYPEVEQGFVNMVLMSFINHLRVMTTSGAFETVYNVLRDEGFGKMGICGKPEEYFFSAYHYKEYLAIMQNPLAVYLSDRREAAQTAGMAHRRTWFFRRAAGAMRRIKDHGLRHTLRLFMKKVRHKMKTCWRR